MKSWCWNPPYLAKGFNVHSSCSLNITNLPLIICFNTDTVSTKMQHWRWVLTMELPLHGNFKNEHTRCHYTTIISSNLLHWLLSSLDEVGLKSKELYMCMSKTDLQVINVAKINQLLHIWQFSTPCNLCQDMYATRVPAWLHITYTWSVTHNISCYNFLT